LRFSNSYHQLGEDFFQPDLPTSVVAPKLILWNSDIAALLTIPKSLQDDHEQLAQYFSGNQLLQGSEPIALAYSGHQFAHFTPNLGDGRAHLLGEVITENDHRLDVQLKGSGRTAFSRRGDGRCAYAPAVREYLMSEAMQALGVPTSRCLAVVTTGEKIYRETEKQGAVVTRVASSHIRVGTFQYFAARGDVTSLQKLTDYAITRHFPHINSANIDNEERILQFLKAVIAKQIKLVVEWLRVGFIHGVMNTDNTAISGETIDFGPCAMMGIYHPDTVYSSIDTQGRYAFANQSHIAQWNMARLAECLLMLLQDKNEADIDDDGDSEVLTAVKKIIMEFTGQFDQAYQTMMAAKLGFALEQQSEKQNSTVVMQITELLTLMADEKLDYTQTFHLLTQSLSDELIAEQLKVTLGAWYINWRNEIGNETQQSIAAQQIMQGNNPVVIPRNHIVEQLLAESELSGDLIHIEEFLKVIGSPYQVLAETHKYQNLPSDGDKRYQTFCGT